MENLKKLNRVCWVLGIVTGVVMVLISLMCVWVEDGEELFEELWRPFLTALILFVAAAATIILNNALMRFACRKEAKAAAPADPQPPESSE